MMTGMCRVLAFRCNFAARSKPLVGVAKATSRMIRSTSCWPMSSSACSADRLSSVSNPSRRSLNDRIRRRYGSSSTTKTRRPITTSVFASVCSINLDENTQKTMIWPLHVTSTQVCRSGDSVVGSGTNQFHGHHDEVEDSEGGDSATNSRGVEDQRGGQRHLHHQQTPQPGPGQPDHQQADLNQVADVDHRGQQAKRFHRHIIVEGSGGRSC